ncbi:uncharacterized protein LOC110245803 [Exaiptasia diaphana]|uniref:NAD-dependent epimerase/dehydratase domain-containing protein n=1 Tax=Exaiptasia diaphana TaxID=2652724 RepID=A0A913XPU7_EXADI|nr:uncharacterized protein LOC110245803 [Exaiptasia diaphana]
MELVVRSYHRTYWDQLPAIGITRCANVFGYGDVNQRRVIPLFVTKALREREIELKYRKNGRQFIHMADAISGYVLAASGLNEGGQQEKKGLKKPEGTSPFTPTFHFAIEEYGVAGEPFIRMQELAERVAALLDSKVKESPDCRDYAENENKIQALSCKQTRAALGWQVRRTLDTEIRHLATWYGADLERHDLETLISRDIDDIVTALASAQENPA